MPPSPAFSSLWPTQRCCWVAYSALKLRQRRPPPATRFALPKVKSTYNAFTPLVHSLYSVLFKFMAASSCCLCLATLPFAMPILGESNLSCLLIVVLRNRRNSMIFSGFHLRNWLNSGGICCHFDLAYALVASTICWRVPSSQYSEKNASGSNAVPSGTRASAICSGLR